MLCRIMAAQVNFVNNITGTCWKNTKIQPSTAQARRPFTKITKRPGRLLPYLNVPKLALTNQF